MRTEHTGILRKTGQSSRIDVALAIIDANNLQTSPHLTNIMQRWSCRTAANMVAPLPLTALFVVCWLGFRVCSRYVCMTLIRMADKPTHMFDVNEFFITFFREPCSNWYSTLHIYLIFIIEYVLQEDTRDGSGSSGNMGRCSAHFVCFQLCAQMSNANT